MKCFNIATWTFRNSEIYKIIVHKYQYKLKGKKNPKLIYDAFAANA